LAGQYSADWAIFWLQRRLGLVATQSASRFLGRVGAIRITTASGGGWASKKIIGTCPPLVLSNPRIRCGFGGKAKNRLMSANPRYLDVKTSAINFGFYHVRGHRTYMARCLLNAPLTLTRLADFFSSEIPSTAAAV
jgi:hypothetical protein